jgi:hypothetical protein
MKKKSFNLKEKLEFLSTLKKSVGEKHIFKYSCYKFLHIIYSFQKIDAFKKNYEH